jgi:hypothetical protein
MLGRRYAAPAFFCHMTRSDLIAELAASTPGLRHADAERIVTVIFDQILDALAHGDRVSSAPSPPSPSSSANHTPAAIHGPVPRSR